jgi:hypothetical protein
MPGSSGGPYVVALIALLGFVAFVGLMIFGLKLVSTRSDRRRSRLRPHDPSTEEVESHVIDPVVSDKTLDGGGLGIDRPGSTARSSE